MNGAPLVAEQPNGGIVIDQSPHVTHASPLLSTFSELAHGITKRVPSLGSADGNVGYGPPRDREDAWKMRSFWMASAGLDPEAIATAHQTHGDGVLVVTVADAGRGARPGSAPVGYADALVTNEPDVVLMTLHADCMPVLLYDPVRQAAATIHAGWRGTVANVCGATLRTMSQQFGTRSQDIVAYLGPAIGPCCYEVGDDVRNAWQATETDPVDRAIAGRDDRWTFDLDIANRITLELAGVLSDRIESSGICTKCQGHEWFSHRGQGPATGRYGAFVALVDPAGKDVARV